MIEDRTSRILELMNQGHSFDRIAADLLPERDAEVMRRTALMRRLDLSAFEFMLGDTVANPKKELDNLKAADQIKTNTLSPGVFSVPKKLRDIHLDHWDVVMNPSGSDLTGKDVEIFRKLNLDLANHFKPLGPKWELEYLHHLLPANPGAGIEHMEELLRERLPQPEEKTQGVTDARIKNTQDGIALALAFDALNVVEEQLPFVPPDCKDRYKAARRLVEAWSFWCDAWFRTRRYISRSRVHEWFADLHAPKNKRILEIYAPGGSGKTMSLRWLITHHCIPRRKPIAHLDFDRFIGQRQSSWQLLLRCAEQLNRQLARAPFDTLIREGQDLEKALMQPSGSDDPNPSLDEARIKGFELEFPRRFGNILNSNSESVVTIIVDTFEEAMVRSLTPVASFIAILVRFAGTCSHVRLIICGRYPLKHLGFSEIFKDEYPDEHKFYESQVRIERLPQFDKTECGIYLAKRGVNLSDEYLTKLFEVSMKIVVSEAENEENEVSPFLLSLIADLIRDRQDNRQQIDQLLVDIDKVKVIYLIERVISRIKDIGVRWLLRYGVVPRRLSKDFFIQVITPHLNRINRGRSKNDDPGKDDIPPDLHEESLYFKESAILDEKPDAIWDQLCLYASPDSWVEKLGNDVLSFHICVREPMRTLLRQHGVLRCIHHDAINYFEAKAHGAGTKAERTTFLQESVYHCFQLKGEKAQANWKKRINEYLKQEDFDAAFAVAKEITGYEYRPSGGAPFVDEKALEFSYTAEVLAALDLYDLSDDDLRKRDEWLRASVQALNRIQSLNAPEEASMILRAMLTVRQYSSRDTLRDACQTLQTQAARKNLPPSIRPRIDRSLAVAWERLNDKQCVGTFARLLRKRLHDPDAARRPMSIFLVQSFARTIAHYGGSPEEFKLLTAAINIRDLEEELQIEVTRSLAFLLDACMRPEAAGALIDQSTHVDDPELSLLSIRTRAKNHPEKAIKQLQDFRARFRKPEEEVHRATSLIVEAWSAEMRSDIYASKAALDDALGLFMKADRSNQAHWCHVLEAKFWLHHHANFSRAREALERSRRSVHSVSGDADSDTLSENLLEFEIAMRSGEPSKEFYNCESLLEQAERSSKCEDRIHCAVTMLSLLEPPMRGKSIDRIADLMISSFEQMPDALARANYPWVLRDLRHEVRLNQELEDRLVILVTISEPPPLLLGQKAGASDLAWAALTHAHLLRFIGRTDRAKEMAGIAESYFTKLNSLTGLREVWHLKTICGLRHITPDEFDAYRDQSPYLEMVIAVEQAEHCLERKDITASWGWMKPIDLNKLSEFPSSFSPRAFLVLATLAEAEVIDEPIEKFIQIAEKGYRRLGDNRAADHCQNRIRELHKSSGTASKNDDPKLLWPVFPCYSLAPEKYFNTRELGADGKRWVKYFTDVEGDLSLEKVTLKREVAPYVLVEFVANSPHMLAGPIFNNVAEGENLQEGKGPRDVILRGGQMAWAGVPWELARLNLMAWTRYELRLLYRSVAPDEDYRSRWLQQALRKTVSPSLFVNGLWGPQTAAALGEFSQLAGIKNVDQLKSKLRLALKSDNRPVAVILESTSERQETSQRGLAFAGSMLPKLYEECGFKCEVFYGLDLNGFFSEWRPLDPPAIIHVYAPYIESRSTGGVAPDFGGRYTNHSKSRTEQSEDLLNQSCVSLIILDGPAEPEPTEQVRQIFLRNAAATILSQNRAFPNILGLGLDRYPEFEVYEKLFVGIREGRSFRELYHAITEDCPVKDAAKLNTELLYENTGRLAPALWTEDPDLSVLL